MMRKVILKTRPGVSSEWWLVLILFPTSTVEVTEVAIPTCDEGQQ